MCYERDGGRINSLSGKNDAGEKEVGAPIVTACGEKIAGGKTTSQLAAVIREGHIAVTTIPIVQQCAADCMDYTVVYEAHDLHQQTNSNPGRNKVTPDHEQQAVETKSLAVLPNLKFWKR
jgi:hypothetical protein